MLVEPCQPILTHKLPNKINHLNYHYFPALDRDRAVAVEITLVIGNESRIDNSSAPIWASIRVAASLSILGVVFVINNKELCWFEEFTARRGHAILTTLTHSRTTLDIKTKLVHSGSGDELTLAVHLPRDR